MSADRKRLLGTLLLVVLNGVVIWLFCRYVVPDMIRQMQAL